ncbi:MAG: beta-ketoacyl-ACP synthase II, partial [Halioglobus sp.]|nr:beta-ketoacyl-ACP synthase II [Halioglobus sp.]
MNGRRVVVTGLGMVSPVGNTVADTWASILAGKSGAATIDRFDVSAFATQFSCSVKDFDIAGYLTPKEARKLDVFVQYGMAAGIQAVQDSGLEVTEENAPRIGCSIGSGIGGIGQIEKNAEILRNGGPRKISPFFVPGSIINMISGNLSVKYNFQGPSLAMVTACTSGTHNIGIGAR